MTHGQVRRLVHGTEELTGQLEKNTATSKQTQILTIFDVAMTLRSGSRKTEQSSHALQSLRQNTRLHRAQLARNAYCCQRLPTTAPCTTAAQILRQYSHQSRVHIGALRCPQQFDHSLRAHHQRPRVQILKRGGEEPVCTPETARPSLSRTKRNIGTSSRALPYRTRQEGRVTTHATHPSPRLKASMCQHASTS